MLRYLLPYVPEQFGTYHEPFLGGGALFFELQPRRAHLSDNNERLARSYAGLRADVESVIVRLRGYPYDKDFYLSLRQVDIDAQSDEAVAAWLIYLNKTGYNGLYRVNRRNVFNVPFGRHHKPVICDEENLRACAVALRGARLHQESFEKVARRARTGDFVYFDPPYEPMSPTASFTSYTTGGFTLDDQRALRDVACKLKARGVHVLISNSSAKPIRDLYRRGFSIHRVPAIRLINSKTDRRGEVTELIIC